MKCRTVATAERGSYTRGAMRGTEPRAADAAGDSRAGSADGLQAARRARNSAARAILGIAPLKRALP